MAGATTGMFDRLTLSTASVGESERPSLKLPPMERSRPVAAFTAAAICGLYWL